MKPPTKWAYMAACQALWKHRENGEKLAAANKALKAENVELRKKIRLLRKRNKRQDQIASKSLL